MRIETQDLAQVEAESIRALGELLDRTPKTISVEETRVTRVWSNPGSASDRAQGIEPGEAETESYWVEDANPEYEALVAELRRIERDHPREDCRALAGEILARTGDRDARGSTWGAWLVLALILSGLLIIAWGLVNALR